MAATPGSGWLIVGGAASVAAALLHLMAIVGGGKWYRFLGAGEKLARAVERGDRSPALLTLGIAITLMVWAAYAFSGAGLIGPMPLLRTGLVVIALVCLGRGLAVLAPKAWRPDLSFSFKLWSSLIVLGIGTAYAVGTWQAWPHLSHKETRA